MSLQASGYSFAALRADGSVVCWGEVLAGGDCSSLPLSGVKAIFSTGGAFAATTVVTVAVSARAVLPVLPSAEPGAECQQQELQATPSDFNLPTCSRPRHRHPHFPQRW